MKIFRRRKFFIFFASCLAVVSLLKIFPFAASPEFIYTINQIFRFGAPFLLMGVIWFCPGPFTHVAKFLLILGMIFIAVPLMAPSVVLLPWRIGYFLSFCWVAGMFFVGVAFFALCAGLGNFAQGLLCLAGSLCLAFALGEAWMLLTPQAQDALVNGSAESRYLSRPDVRQYGDNMVSGPGGDFPGGTGKTVFEAGRLLKWDKELFDVLYGFDARGRRRTPEANAQPEHELMLFGCSFTFGVGLNDEQTWAWKLACDLGPQWKVDNYSYAGFGPQQMLSLLEDGSVEKTKAPMIAALYFAIEDQLRRPAGMVYKKSVHYVETEKGLVRAGWTTDTWPAKIAVLPKYLNGSQLARHLSLSAILFLNNKWHKMLEDKYLAIIRESSRLLRKKYGATLTVLLWPDVEYLEPALRKFSIPCLKARFFMKDWDASAGKDYLIDPSWEWHPNEKAAAAIAQGLADYYRNAATGKGAQEQ